MVSSQTAGWWYCKERETWQGAWEGKKMQCGIYQEYYQILQGTGAQVLIDTKYSIYWCWTDSRRGAVSAIQDTTRIF